MLYRDLKFNQVVYVLFQELSNTNHNLWAVRLTWREGRKDSHGYVLSQWLFVMTADIVILLLLIVFFECILQKCFVSLWKQWKIAQSATVLASSAMPNRNVDVF